MKIGIVTFHSAHNYGAVLQAWSLQKYLKNQGHEAEIVNLRLPVIDKLYRLARRTHAKITKIEGIDKLINDGYYWARCAYAQIKDPSKCEKYRGFEGFMKRNLPLSQEFNDSEELRKAALKYDALIAGSDQVWNATMMKGIDPAYFLEFGNSDALRISYAASIGTDEIPAQYRRMFQRYLHNFDAISVREKKAQAEVSKLTDKDVELVADPTFLLKREDFDTLKKDPQNKGKYIYVHNVHLKRVDEALNRVAEEMSKRLNLPIIHNWPQKMYTNEAGHFTGGPEEFLGLVANAEYVITNSFHTTVFSVIYERNFITVPHFKHPDRMQNMLGELGISEHLIGDSDKIPADLADLTIDYAAVKERKGAMGAHAQEFLNHALTLKKQEDNRSYFTVKDDFRCYGCTACRDICPSGAITMVEDSEGFFYPVRNEELCSHCGKCKKVCIYHKKGIKNKGGEGLPAVYAAYAKDAQAVEESAGGGVFTPLYRNILKKGGTVAGVGYDENMKVVYSLADTEAECEKFRGYNPVEADCDKVKPQVQALLEAGKYVLFFGTPCQIAGLKSFLGKDYEKLVTVEGICGGAASPKAFRLYKEFLEESYKSKVTDIQFDNKFKGADKPYVKAEFASGSMEIENGMTHNFNRPCVEGYLQRPTCYTCEFMKLKNGVADITLGNYQGIGAAHPDFTNDNKGVSVLKINTEKGRALLEELKEELVLKESTYKKAYRENPTQPLLMKKGRVSLMYYLDEKPIDPLLQTFNKGKKGGLKLQ